jgi:hypothetical protein
MTSETDAEFLNRIEQAVETTGDNWIRLLALARRGAAMTELLQRSVMYLQHTPLFDDVVAALNPSPAGETSDE